MGHVVLGNPGIDRCHLHERLRRALRQRGHRVTVLCVDAATALFWRAQGDDVVLAGDEASDDARRDSGLADDARRAPATAGWSRDDGAVLGTPTDAGTDPRSASRPHAAAEPRRREPPAPLRHVAAEVDAQRAAVPAAALHVPIDELAPGVRGARRARLRTRVLAATTWLADARPDLVVLHHDRDAAARMLQFAARTTATRVLWTGDGLLPHTLQLDERGLDGDASCAQRAAGEFRVVRGEPDLLRACLTHALAGNTPFALPRADVRVPPFAARLAALLPAWRDDGLGGAWRALRGWRRALAPAAAAVRPWALPGAPFVALLAQAADDPRLPLDAGGARRPDALIAATVAAVHERLGSGVRVVVVAADARGDGRWPGASTLPAAAGAIAAATALATVTINHPLATVALLAGTPVLHTGRAVYAVRGVATRTTPATLADDLAHALAHDHPTLRQRFLSWVFGHGHVWCSPTHPDHNGMLGLVRAIEHRLVEPPGARPVLGYRAGPAWPLGIGVPERR